MKLVLLLIISLKTVGCNDEFNLIFDIIRTIAKDHYFNYYMLLFSEKEQDKSFYDRLAVLTKKGFGYSIIVQLSIEEYGRYIKRSDFGNRMRCLKILNGRNEKVREDLLELSAKYNLGGNDVWLLFMNDRETMEEYTAKLVLPFNVQFIVALINNLEWIDFKAPYRVGQNFPLRIQNLGNWTKRDGLHLPTVGVARTRRDFEGVHFRAGTLHNPPVTTVIYGKRKGDFKVVGFFIDVFQELSERLNFTYKYSLSVDNGTGTMNPDKTWNGLIGMLLRDEIDIAVSEFTITELRTHYIDFSMPIMTTGMTIFFTQAGDSLELGSLFRPFTAETWLVLMAWIIVATIAMFAFYTIGCRHDMENFVYKQEFSVSGSFFIVFRAFTSQGNNLIPESVPCRIVFSISYLLTSILLPSYSAALISHLTVRNPVRPFNSLEELLELGTYKLSAAKRTAEYVYFSDATEPLLKKTFNKLMKPLKGSDLPVNTAEGVEFACKKKNYAYYGPFLSGKSTADELILEQGCKIMVLENPLGYVDMTYGFQKNSPFSQIINLEVQKMIYEGLLDRIRFQTWPSEKINIGEINFEAIEVMQVIMIHCVLLMGYLLAFSFLLFETMFVKKKIQKKRLRIIQAFPIYKHLELM